MKVPSQNFSDVIIFLDSSNQIVGVNSVGERLLKINTADLLGKSVDEIFPQQSSTAYRNEILTDGRKEVNLRLSGGKSLYAELTVSSIVASDGTLFGRVLNIRDNNKSQESAMRFQQGEVLEQQNAVLRALQETTIDLHSSLDLDTVLSNIVARACTLFGTMHGFIDIVKDTGELEPMVGVGSLDEALNFKVVKGEGVAGTVWKTGKPLVIPVYDKWQERVQHFQHNVIRSIVGMPLMLDKQVVGVIGIARGIESTETFSEDDVSLLRQFADLAVIAMQNARLYEKAQQELEFRRKTEIELRNANQVLQLQIEQVELLQKRLQELAIRDPLTELYNRRYLKEVLDVELANPERSSKSLAILMMDSDQLKTINDRYGHKAGDDFLVLIADVIKDNIRAGDIACRYGGDEYVVVMSDVTPESAFERAENLRQEIAEKNIVHRNKSVNISVSIGIAVFPEHGSLGEELLQRADQALYKAKDMGKNCVVLFSKDQEQTS